jgi:uncharacterized protein (UPF0332 family)
MKPADLEALVTHRLQKAEEALEAAKIMMDSQMFSFAMNRVYYSLYYAVQALLAQQGVAFSKHGQVKGYFNHEFIKTGKLPKEIGRFYNKAFEYRQKFDYVDFLSPDEPMVCEYVETAKSIVYQIRRYLGKELAGDQSSP